MRRMVCLDVKCEDYVIVFDNTLDTLQFFVFSASG